MEHVERPILRSEHQKGIEMVIASEENAILPVARKSSCCSTCAFSKQKNKTRESEERSKSATKLSALIIFYTIVMTVEVVGGAKANSLAVITDAAHLLSDVAGFSISLFAVWASGWEATSHQSFGYSRLEVLGALLSVQLIWLISGMLIYEAINRILHQNAEVRGGLMFAIAAFGFVINIIMVFWLGHDHHHHTCHDHNHDAHNHDDHNHDDHSDGHIHNHGGEELGLSAEEEATLVLGSPIKKKILNINIQGAYLHVISDVIQSAGVMIAGIIILIKPGWLIVDLVCTLIFSTLVLVSTLPMLRDVFRILMEGTPSEVDVGKLESGLKCIKGVQEVHDLHVWSITVGKVVLCCHVSAEPGASCGELLKRIRDYCETMHRIHHVTVQIES